jgi:hypothetical protein
MAYPKRSKIADVGVYNTKYIESIPFEVVQLPHLVCTATCGSTTFVLFVLELQDGTALKHITLLSGIGA